MTLKAELPVFPEGGIYPPPWAEKPKYPPLAENTPLWKFWSFPLPGINACTLYMSEVKLNWTKLKNLYKCNFVLNPFMHLC